ncbi:hypothetical protein [Parasegetibacter sp. NRK P23]|uniref:hypothetical protein n=1 Tax=Parasegetibacter sp. NRK P23 TaxID=2942999 RepID=UPI0020445A84|nr:hypothetical protein [Parasegetibacter sp. NRK P23]MCM5530613.1 hypothetical protein [Parasegetibacter sp. NRK P23]
MKTVLSHCNLKNYFTTERYLNAILYQKMCKGNELRLKLSSDFIKGLYYSARTTDSTLIF